MRRFLTAAATLTAIAAPLSAHGAGTVEVMRPWSRPAAAGTNGIGYMVLANHGRGPEILESVESPIAARVEIHSSSMAGGVMSMKKDDRAPIPAGGQITFGPGAYHLMFIGLNRALKAGDQPSATLRFASGAKIAVRFPVSGMGPPAPGDVRR